jgi:hypothetical protein
VHEVGTGNLFAPYFCLAMLIANHSIFRLGALPEFWAVITIATIAIITFCTPNTQTFGYRVGKPDLKNIAIGCIVVTPALASLLFGWNREFPFSGDHAFHIRRTLQILMWWLWSPARMPEALQERHVQELINHPQMVIWSRAAVLLATVGFTAWCYRRDRRLALLFAVVVVIIWARCEGTILLRYPGGGYFIAAPFVLFGVVADNLEITNRMANLSACIVWLFVLRPWIVGYWPNARILPAAALLLWQKDVLYYFDSTYLEPWAFVFCLLAVELLVSRGRTGATVACLLIGAAGAIKEPPIMALPLMWLAGVPWRRNLRDFLSLSGAALAAGFPFILYYVANASVPDNLIYRRGMDLHPTVDSLRMYASEFVHRMGLAFDGTTAIVAVAALAVMPYVLLRKNFDRVSLGFAFSAGLLLIVLFAIDQNSLYWAGYFRFFLYAFPFLACGAIAFGYATRPRIALYAGVLALILQLPGAARAVALSAGPATARNFLEHYDSPILFPIWSVVKQASMLGLLPENAVIIANQPDPEVKDRPRSPVVFDTSGKLHCECQATERYVLALFVRYANLNAPFADRPPHEHEIYAPPFRRDQLWRELRSVRSVCLARLAQTCSHVFERSEGGEVVTALGVR